MSQNFNSHQPSIEDEIAEAARRSAIGLYTGVDLNNRDNTAKGHQAGLARAYMEGYQAGARRTLTNEAEDAARYGYARDHLHVGKYHRDSIAQCECDFDYMDDAGIA